MNVEETNQNRAAESLTTEISTQPPEGDPPKSWRRFLVPGMIGLVVLGGVGWIVLNRVILPILMFSNMKPMAMPVPVGNPRTDTVADSSDYVANLQSRQSVTLQPRVSGQITAIYVKAGDRVEAGTQVLQIDATEQRAQVDSRTATVASAAADVASAQADVANARDTLQSLAAKRAANLSTVEFNRREYERFVDLVKQGAASQQTLDQKRTALQTAQADLAQAEADMQAQKAAIARTQSNVARNQRLVQQSQANVAEGAAKLQFYSIAAPFAGTVGDIPMKVGDFVDTSTRLLSITQNQTLEVTIAIPLEKAPDLRRGMTVQLVDDGDKVLQTGRIFFIAPNVDPQTQAVQVKAEFNNVGGKLRTDQFVRARVIWAQRPGLLVPTTAIARLGGKDFLFVATPYKNSDCSASAQGAAPPGAPGPAPDSIIALQKPIKLGKIFGNEQVVLEGVSATDQIVVSGILNLQNCMAIAPHGEKK